MVSCVNLCSLIGQVGGGDADVARMSAADKYSIDAGIGKDQEQAAIHMNGTITNGLDGAGTFGLELLNLSAIIILILRAILL